MGSELRRQAMVICQLVARAAQARDLARREPLLEQLVWRVKDTKIGLQLAKELEAFAAQFQRLAEQAVALGRQSGGWWKQARSAGYGASHAGAPQP